MATRPLLTVLIPTRQRNAEVVKCVNSAIENAEGWPLHFILGYDDDAEGYLTAPNFPETVKVTAVHLKPRHYYVRAVNALFQFASQSEEFDYFLLSNDDVTFAPNWPKLALHGLRAFPQRLGVCELAGPDMCAHYVSRREFFDTYFQRLLGEPCYTFYFSDRELMMRTKLIGRYLYLSGPDGLPLVRHVQAIDNVRREVDRWFLIDEQEYFRRRVQHSEWPCTGVPRRLFQQIFSGPPA